MAEEREFDVIGELSQDGSSLILHHAEMLKRLISPLKGERLRIRFAKLRHKRSDAQNRWMWGVCVPTVRAWLRETEGLKHDPDEVYTWLRISILGYKPTVRYIGGEEVIVMTGKRFSQMNTKEFSDAVEEIVQKLAERGCEIPLPNEQNFITDFLEQ